MADTGLIQGCPAAFSSCDIRWEWEEMHPDSDAKKKFNCGNENKSANGEEEEEEVTSREEGQRVNVEKKETFLPPLNVDVLLKILSEADLGTVCRFSRTCSWAKEFVDSNINHLPRLRIELSIIVKPSLTEYTTNLFEYFYRGKMKHLRCFNTTHHKIQNYPARKLKAVSSVYDIERLIRESKYLDFGHVHLACQNVPASYTRMIIYETTEQGLNSNEIDWTTSTGSSIFLLQSDYDYDPALTRQYLRDLCAAGLEVMDDGDSTENSRKTFAKLVAVSYRLPFLVRFSKTENDWSMDQILAFVVQVLKDADRASKTPEEYCRFPSIEFRGAYAWQPSFTDQNLLFLCSEMEKWDLSCHYKVWRYRGKDNRIAITWRLRNDEPLLCVKLTQLSSGEYEIIMEDGHPSCSIYFYTAVN